MTRRPAPRHPRSLVAGLRELGVAAALVAMPGCLEPLSHDAPTDAPLSVGARRDVTLRYLRFDVQNYEQTLTRSDLLALPRDTQRRLWLLDLDLSNGPNAPRFVENALETITDADPTTLEPAARNLQRLLRMTPDTADLTGTSFEDLVALAPGVGISAARVLADLSGANVEDRFLPSDAVAETLLANVIGTHPAAQRRLGPRTAAAPDGVYVVAPGAIPITLADAASDFATLGEVFGEAWGNGVYHPGFVVGDVRASLLGPDFAITVRANANALPFKGVDLSLGAVASVNSVESQIATLFNFDDPAWIDIRGLLPGTPTIDELTFTVREDPAFHRGGDAPFPAPWGSSPAWTLPPWTFERVVLDASLRAFGGLNGVHTYGGGEGEPPLVEVRVRDGWTEVDTRGGVGAPPPPAYVWDILLELAQVRLHDGGIAEGGADARFTLRDVPVGIDTRVIEATIRANLESDPLAMLGLAETILDTTQGAADFYYVRDAGADGEVADWLFFVAPSDLARDERGAAMRPYAYANPGFFADAELTERVSSAELVAGDAVRQKVRLFEGQTLFVEDDEGKRYAVTMTGRDGRSSPRLAVERVR